MSQDHLEMFFSSIRYHGGCNNNPTARQFRAAYKKLLVNAQLKPSHSGNCIPLSEITVLNVFSYHSSKDVINLTSKSIDNANENSTSVLLEHNYVFDAGLLDEFSQDVIFYIARFLAKKLNSVLKCFPCTDVLIAKEPPLYINFITYKSYGKLVFPSDDSIKYAWNVNPFSGKQSFE